MDSLKEEKKEKSGKTRREVSTGISSSDPKYTELFDAFWKVYLVRGEAIRLRPAGGSRRA